MFERGARGDRSAIESAIREGGDVDGWSGILRSVVLENDKGSLVSLTSLGTLPIASRAGRSSKRAPPASRTKRAQKSSVSAPFTMNSVVSTWGT